jgi:hypothetical protein
MSIRKVVYFDVDNLVWCLSDGSPILSPTKYPTFQYKEVSTLELHLLDGNGDAYTGLSGQTVSFSAAIDNDWVHTHEGALTSGASGAITSIGISGLTSEPLPSGSLKLTNDAGETETVAYTAASESSGTYTFTVSVTLTYTYLTGDVAEVVDPPMVKTLNAQIDQTDKDTGLLLVDMDCNNLAYKNKVGTSKQASGCIFELKVYDVSGYQIMVYQGDVNCRNVVDDEGNIPPAPSSDYYTKTQVDALLPSAGTPVVTIWIDPIKIIPCTTNGAQSGTKEYAADKATLDYLAFDGGAIKERAQFKLCFPSNWDAGTVTAKFYWSSDTGSTAGDTVEWGIKAISLRNDDAIATAFGTAQVISDTLLANDGADMQVSSATSAITIGGTPANGSMVVFEVYRNTDGTDDMTEDAWLFGIEITFST